MAPEAWSHSTSTDVSTVSLALTAKLAAAPLGPVALRLMFAGRLSVGAVVSTTWTVKITGWAIFSCVSMALQVTVVFPTGKVEPDAGVHVTATLPSTASEADGVE